MVLKIQKQWLNNSKKRNEDKLEKDKNFYKKFININNKTYCA